MSSIVQITCVDRIRATHPSTRSQSILLFSSFSRIILWAFSQKNCHSLSICHIASVVTTRQPTLASLPSTADANRPRSPQKMIAPMSALFKTVGAMVPWREGSCFTAPEQLRKFTHFLDPRGRDSLSKKSTVSHLGYFAGAVDSRCT